MFNTGNPCGTVGCTNDTQAYDIDLQMNRCRECAAKDEAEIMCKDKNCDSFTVENTYYCDAHLKLEKEELLAECASSPYGRCIGNPERYSNYDLLKMLNYPVDGKGKARCSTKGCGELGYRHDKEWLCKECSNITDGVNHPPHYTTGKIETIDVITDWNLNYCEGNVIKYLSRYKHKGTPLRDLKKAEWYLKRLIKQNEE
ncbi:hypothetical protein LCGC14_0995040 [marine sediment metagenome]|uniref:DUF3310 domain-containing protein n=1 Tax=marine sediment metagenome TaxID=412755 RepID=A0A0F9NR26_9ZZZZ